MQKSNNNHSNGNFVANGYAQPYQMQMNNAGSQCPSCNEYKPK